MKHAQLTNTDKHENVHLLVLSGNLKTNYLLTNKAFWKYLIYSGAKIDIYLNNKTNSSPQILTLSDYLSSNINILSTENNHI